MGATRALYYEHGLGTPGLGLTVALSVAILCVVVARTKSLHEGFIRVPLWLLAGVHTVRLLGISFVVLYAANRLPAPFAPVAGWGDIFVGDDRSGRGVVNLPASLICSVDPVDLECDWNNGFGCGRRIGGNFIARRPSASDLC